MHINKNIAISVTGFVFNPLSKDSFSTNQVGQEVFRKLQSRASRAEHISTLFSADQATVEKDLSDLNLLIIEYLYLMQYC